MRLDHSHLIMISGKLRLVYSHLKMVSGNIRLAYSHLKMISGKIRLGLSHLNFVSGFWRLLNSHLYAISSFLRKEPASGGRLKPPCLRQGLVSEGAARGRRFPVSAAPRGLAGPLFSQPRPGRGPGHLIFGPPDPAKALKTATSHSVQKLFISILPPHPNPSFQTRSTEEISPKSH